MAATVTANGRTIVHAGSEGVSTAFPDACEMPNGVVVPCFNTAFSEDVVNCAETVFADGFPVATNASWFDSSTGNEATIGGVISGEVKGKASFINWSTNVFVEGKPVPRNGDPMVHNHGSPPNAFGPELVQPNVDIQDVIDKLCEVFCECNNRGNTYCAHQHLALERKVGSRSYWDPPHPRVYVEVPYDMSAPGGPEPMLSSTERSAFPPYHPIPERAFPPIAGAPRPDVSITRNPSLPLTRANLARIADFKFDGDRFRTRRRGLEDQRKAYEKIDPSGRGPLVIDKSECKCADGKSRRRVRERVEEPNDEPIPIPPPTVDPRLDDYDKTDEKDDEKRRPRPPVTAYAEAALLMAVAAIIILDPVPGDEPALAPILARLAMLLK